MTLCLEELWEGQGGGRSRAVPIRLGRTVTEIQAFHAAQQTATFTSSPQARGEILGFAMPSAHVVVNNLWQFGFCCLPTALIKLGKVIQGAHSPSPPPCAGILFSVGFYSSRSLTSTQLYHLLKINRSKYSKKNQQQQQKLHHRQ